MIRRLTATAPLVRRRSRLLARRAREVARGLGKLRGRLVLRPSRCLARLVQVRLGAGELVRRGGRSARGGGLEGHVGVDEGGWTAPDRRR